MFELRSGVGFARSTDETAEGNEAGGGKGRTRGALAQMSQGRTQSRTPLQPRLARVNAAARSAAQTRFTALLHHIDHDALGFDSDGAQRRESTGSPCKRTSKILQRTCRSCTGAFTRDAT